MYRAIILDDEKKICTLIQRLVDWSAVEVELAGVFQNSLEAFSFIEANRPEIILTDVNMPGMDGMALLRRLREARIDAQVLLISGHDRFDYVKTAMEYGACNYLLKPLQKTQIEDNLRRIVGRLQEQAQAREDSELALCYRRQAREDEEAWLLRELIAGRTPAAPHGFRLDAPLFQLLLLKPGFAGLESADARTALLRGAMDRLRAALEPHCMETVSAVLEQGGFCMACHTGLSLRQLEDALRGASLSLPTGCTLTLGCSESVRALTQLDWRQAVQAVDARLYLGVGRVISPDEAVFDQTALLTAPIRQSLRDGFELADEPRVRRVFDEIAGRCRQVHTAPAQLYAFCREAAVIAEQALELPPDRQQLLRLWEDSRSIPELLDQTCVHLLSHLQTVRTAKKPEGRAVRMAKQYVSDHLASEIRLDDVADLVYMNAAYFSVFFKRETGENFSDYLVRTRMERAKRYLRETDLSISVVGERVGYRDAAYFSRQFTRVTGLKPSHYRRQTQ